MKHATPSNPDWLRGTLRRLHGLLNQPIQLRRTSPGILPIIAPASPTDIGHQAQDRREALPPMSARQVANVRADLRKILDREAGDRRLWPSLALLERALRKQRADGIDQSPAWVLRHAAQSLDRLDGDGLDPGLVILRRRVELVLRRRHGDQPSHWASSPRRPERQEQLPGFRDSLTEFMELEAPRA